MPADLAGLMILSRARGPRRRLDDSRRAAVVWNSVAALGGPETWTAARGGRSQQVV